MKKILLLLFLTSNSVYAQVSPLSNDFVASRADSSFQEVAEAIALIQPLLDYVVDEKFNYNIYLDNHEDVGREILSNFLGRKVTLNPNFDLSIKNEEAFVSDFVNEFLQVEAVRSSFSELHNWAQIPDIVASGEISQLELKWRCSKVIKQLKILAENYLAQAYLIGKPEEEKALKLQAEIGKKWDAIVNDSLSFEIVFNALQQTENEHLRELKNHFNDLRKNEFSKEQVEKLNDYLATFPYQALNYLLEAPKEYIEQVVSRSEIHSQSIDTVRAYWSKMYENVILHQDSMAQFIQQSAEALKRVEEGYLDLCRNFDLLEVDADGKSVLNVSDVQSLAARIIQKVNFATVYKIDTLNWSMNFLPLTEMVLQTPFREFQYYRNFLKELENRNPAFAADLYNFIGVDTAVFNEVDLEAKLKQLQDEFAFTKQLLQGKFDAIAFELLNEAGFLAEKIERNGNRLKLHFRTCFFPTQNAWIKVGDANELVVEIPVPKSLEEGVENCSKALSEELKKQEIVLDTEALLESVFLSKVPKAWIPKKMFYLEGDHLRLEFADNAPIQCLAFANATLEECTTLPYDALKSSEDFVNALRNHIQQVYIDKWLVQLESELKAVLRENNLPTSEKELREILATNYTFLKDEGLIVRLPLSELLPQWETGIVVLKVSAEGSCSARLENFDNERALITLVNQFPFVKVVPHNDDQLQLLVALGGRPQQFGYYHKTSNEIEINPERALYFTLISGYSISAKRARYISGKLFLDDVVCSVLGEEIPLSTVELKWKNDQLQINIPKSALDAAEHQIIAKIRSKADGALLELILSDEGLRSLTPAGVKIESVQEYIDGVKEQVTLTLAEVEAELRSYLRSYAGFDSITLHWESAPAYVEFDATNTLLGETLTLKNMRLVYHDASHYSLDLSHVKFDGNAIRKLENYLKAVIPQNKYLSIKDVKMNGGFEQIHGSIKMELRIDELGITQSFMTQVSIDEKGIKVAMNDADFWELAGKQVLQKLNNVLTNKQFGNVQILGVDYLKKDNAMYLQLKSKIHIYEETFVPSTLWIPLDNKGKYRLDMVDFMDGLTKEALAILKGKFQFPNEYFNLEVSDVKAIDQSGNEWKAGSVNFPKGLKARAALYVTDVKIPLPDFTLTSKGIEFTSMSVVSVEWPSPILLPPYVKFTNVGLDLDLDSNTLNFRGDASYIAEGSEYLIKMHGDHILDIEHFETVFIKNDLLFLGFLSVMESNELLNFKDLTYEKNVSIGEQFKEVILLEAKGEVGLKKQQIGVDGTLEFFGEDAMSVKGSIDLKALVLDLNSEVEFFKSSASARVKTEGGLSHPELTSRLDFRVPALDIKIGASEISVSENSAFIDFEFLGAEFGIGASNIKNLEGEVEKALRRLLDIDLGKLDEMLQQILAGNLRINPFSDFGSGKSFGSSSGKGGSKGGDGKNNGGSKGKGQNGRYSANGLNSAGTSTVGVPGNSAWKNEFNPNGASQLASTNPGGSGGSTINGSPIPNENGTDIVVTKMANGTYKLSHPETKMVFAYIPKAYGGVTFVGNNNQLNKKLLNTFGSAIVFYVGDKFYCFNRQFEGSPAELKPIVIPFLAIDLKNEAEVVAAATNWKQRDNTLRFHLLTQLIYNGQPDSKTLFYTGKGYAFSVEKGYRVFYYQGEGIVSKFINTENVNPSQIRMIIEQRMQ